MLGALALGYFAGNVLPNNLLPAHPVAAARPLELSVFLPGTLAALAAAVVIVVSVSLEASTGASSAETKTVDAVSTAITALVTAIFLKIFEDADDDVVGARVKTVFRSHYKRFEPNTQPERGAGRFDAGSPGENWGGFVFKDFRASATASIALEFARSEHHLPF